MSAGQDDLFSIEGRVAIVTGASSGLGRRFAKVLHERGANVVVAARRSSHLEQLVEECPGILPVTVDLAQSGAAAKILESTLAGFAQVDIVVNNAGNLRDAIFHRMTEADFDAVIAVHLKGTFNVSRAAAPHFKTQGSGCYVHMTSTSGLIGNFGQANYSAAKMGIAALSKSIALDMQRFGVRSNAVAPFAWTRMIDSIPSETPEQKRRVEGLKKLVPERVAPFVVGLCADAAHDAGIAHPQGAADGRACPAASFAHGPSGRSDTASGATFALAASASSGATSLML